MSENSLKKFIEAINTEDVKAALKIIKTSGLLNSNNWLCQYKFLKQDEGDKNDSGIKCNSNLNLLRLLLRRASKEFLTKMLRQAVTNRYDIIVAFLLENMPNKVNVNAYGEDGETALLTASAYCLTNLVYILLDHDADIHAKCEKPSILGFEEGDVGKTALHLAAEYGEPEMIQILLACGADVNATDAAGSTCLHLACESYDDNDKASVLVEAGADCNVKDNRGRTPLHVAAKMMNAKVILMLLENGADVNITCNDSMTPLDYVLSAKHPCDDVVDDLKKHIITIKALDLHVSDSNLKHIDLNGKDRLTFEWCKKNLAVKICRSNISFYDFLTGNTKQLMVWLQDENLCEALENICKKKICCNDHAKICCPSYRSLILARFQEKERMLLLNSSLERLKIALVDVFGKELPENVLLPVVESFSNEELKNVIKSAASER